MFLNDLVIAVDQKQAIFLIPKFLGRATNHVLEKTSGLIISFGKKIQGHIATQPKITQLLIVEISHGKGLFIAEQNSKNCIILY